jgi:hypothetical protein
MKNRSDTRPATNAIRATTAADLEREFYNAAQVIAENATTQIKNTPRREKGRSTKPRKI